MFRIRELGEIIKKLRELLVYIFNCYLIVIGRLVKEIDGMEENWWKVKSNDVGVRMIEVRVIGMVEEWCRSVNREEEFKFVYWEDMYYFFYYWFIFYV